MPRTDADRCRATGIYRAASGGRRYCGCCGAGASTSIGLPISGAVPSAGAAGKDLEPGGGGETVCPKAKRVSRSYFRFTASKPGKFSPQYIRR